MINTLNNDEYIYYTYNIDNALKYFIFFSKILQRYINKIQLTKFSQNIKWLFIKNSIFKLKNL